MDRALLFLLAAAFLAGPAAGCSCQSAHPQQLFCKSDFVITAKIVEAKFEENKITYFVEIKKFFKGTNETREAIQKVGIWSPLHDSACGVRFKEEATYLIMGRLVSMHGRKDAQSTIAGMRLQPAVTLCDYSRPWRDVTVRQRKGVRVQYSLGCACKPRMCPWGRRNRSAQLESCLVDHSVCVPNHKNQCRWLRGARFDVCMEAAEERAEIEKLRLP